MKKTNWSQLARITAVAVIGIGLVQKAHATSSATDAGRLSIGPRVGYYQAKDGDNGKFTGGAQVRFHMTPTFALEGAIDYRQIDGEDSLGDLDVHFYPVQASLIAYLFPESPLTPYLVAGANWQNITIETPGNDVTKSKLGVHGGVGLQYFMTQNWSVDGSWRYMWIDKVSDGNTDFDPSGHMFSTALNYHFK
jgi:opacity protein-like surface antigen